MLQPTDLDHTNHPIGHVPDDMIFHILQFLPTSVILTKCMIVSKRFLRISQTIEFQIDLSSSSDQHIYNFKNCENIQRISTLDLSHNRLSTEIFRIIFDHSKHKLQTLVSLDLSSINAMSSESVQLVSQCESLQNLTYLDISFAMNEDGMKVLLNSSVLKNLKSLKMVGWAFDTSSRTSLSFVTESEIVKNLECLNLSGNQIDEYRIQAMFQNSNGDSSKLTRLDLSYNNIAFNGIQYLTSSKYIPYLKALTISYNPYIRDSSIVLLTQRDSMKHLTYLDLEGTSIGNESMKALSDISSTITNLTHLKIGKTHVKDEGLKFVTQCSHMSKLTTLSCVRSFIGDEGVYEIASSVFMSNLKHLNLSRCNVTLAGATALMESKLLRPNLRSLNLWQNKLSEEEKEMINTLNEENGWKVVL